TTGDQSHDVLAFFVGAGDPTGAVHYPRVEQVANAVVQQRLRSDVSLDQEGVLGEVGVVEQGVLGRVERGTKPLVVDFAVTGYPDGQQLPVAARLADFQQDVFQGV